MDNVEEVTSSATTKNDLKSKEFVKKKEEKHNPGFLDVFMRQYREDQKRQGNWYDDNRKGKKDEEKTSKDITPDDEFTDSNKSVSEASRQAMLRRIKVNTEFNELQSQKNNKETKKLTLKRETGEAR